MRFFLTLAVMSLTGISMSAHGGFTDAFVDTGRYNINAQTSKTVELPMTGDAADAQQRINPEKILRAATHTDGGEMTFLGYTTVDKLQYAIYGNDRQQTATLIGWADSFDFYPEITVPDNVTYNGISTPVNTINSYAFTNGYGITGLKLGANVQTIGTSAFYSCSITELTIPQDLMYINSVAFYGNPLASVTFENASSTETPLVIGAAAFGNTALTSFEIPARLRIESLSSFTQSYQSFLFNTTNLRSITINPSFAQVDRNYRFEIIDKALCMIQHKEDYDIDAYTIIAYPAASGESQFTLEGGAVDVYVGAFSRANIERVSLTSTSAIRQGKVNLIADINAFSQSNISGLSLKAEGPIRLEPGFTSGCNNLSTYDLAESITNYKVFDNVIYARNNDGERVLTSYPGGKRDAAYTLPDDCLHIAEFGMADNNYITSLTLSPATKSIGRYAFSSCANLKTINFAGEQIVEIADAAFSGTRIVASAPEGEVLLGCTLIGYSGKVPENYVMSSKIKAAVSRVFSNCSDIRSVAFPEDFEHIPSLMFYSCWKLQNITLPKNLKTIGDNAFCYAGAETYSDAEASVETEKILELPDGLVSVDDLAFAFSYRLFSVVVLPPSLETIGWRAFYTNNPLKQVTVKRDTPPVASNAITEEYFSDMTLKNAALVIPNGADAIAFTSTPGWEFVNVKNAELEGIGTATTDTWHVVADGLNLRSADDSEFEVWRTDGISLGTGLSFTLPARGLYIVRHGNTVMKVSI